MTEFLITLGCYTTLGCTVMACASWVDEWIQRKADEL